MAICDVWDAEYTWFWFWDTTVDGAFGFSGARIVSLLVALTLLMGVRAFGPRIPFRISIGIEYWACSESPEHAASVLDPSSD